MHNITNQKFSTDGFQGISGVTQNIILKYNSKINNNIITKKIKILYFIERL